MIAATSRDLVTSGWLSRPAQQAFTFDVVEPAAPVVSTSASSAWSLALMAVLGLGAALAWRARTES